MRGTLQYRFTTARVQWPCSTDIHWACLITQSGPARYVTRWRLGLAIEWSKVEIKLRVRDADTKFRLLRAPRIARAGHCDALHAGRAERRQRAQSKQNFATNTHSYIDCSILYNFLFPSEDPKVAVKNYAVHQSLEDPGSASQQSECNDPAPH